MDDFKIWFYVIVGVIYLLSRVLKQKNKPATDFEDDGPAPTETTGKRPMTFEELLKEITDSKSPQSQTPASQPAMKPEAYKPRPAYVDYDDDLGDEAQDQEDEEYKPDPRTFDIYEKAKKEAFYRPSLEETMKVEDTKPTYGRFDKFSLKKKGTLLREYTNQLRTKAGFKRAVVLNEILNRRF
jgi:hypothetical protein